MHKHSYTLAQITEILGAHLLGDGTHRFSELLIDSRQVTQPHQSLFFALNGPHHKGSKYISELVRLGVKCFVVAPEDMKANLPIKDEAYLVVNNTLDALQRLAAWHLEQFDLLYKVGITGSNGKTIVKEWLAQLLSTHYSICKSPLSYNSQVGVPLSLWLVNEQTECAIFEAGISEPGEMQRLTRIIQPTYGIFTHLGEAHQEHFESLEQKCMEKMSLFQNVKQLVYCRDHKLIHRTAVEQAIPSFTWGMDVESNLSIVHMRINDEYTDITLNDTKEQFSIHIPFTDPVSLENVMHAFTLAWFLEVPLEVLQRQLKLLQPIAMRQEIKEGIHGNIIINDTYNSDLSSIRLSLKLLEQNKLAQLTPVFILSDIFQSGQAPEELYTEVGRMVKEHGIEIFIGVGPDLMRFRHMIKVPICHFYANTEALCESKLLDKLRNTALLIKGARPFRLEKVVKILEKKSYQTTLEVDLNAITYNFNQCRELLHPNTLIMCMVKANAYGCGAVEVARHLQYQGCNYLAVALADEGAELRESGIQIPIVVMNPEPYSFDTILEQGLELEIYSMDLLESFHQFLMSSGVSNYPIHIKIDSGMHRLGFSYEELNLLCRWLKIHKSVQVVSVFSHLAASDDETMDVFTKQQLNYFQKGADYMEQQLASPFLRHILNSAGVKRFTQYQMDMVRLGIGLYGKLNAEDVDVRTVSNLKTQVLQIKVIQKGETIGYGRKGKALTDVRIAILPIGYADGLCRAFGNGKCGVMWNGILLPFIGNICMDMCMIDLGANAITVGDHVTVFGEDQPPYVLAERIGSIPYELLTQISSRVRKVYLL